MRHATLYDHRTVNPKLISHAGKAASAKSPGKSAKGGKRSSGQKRALAQSADGEQAAGSEVAAPVVARLRLLLQLIPALCSYDQVTTARLPVRSLSQAPLVGACQIVRLPLGTFQSTRDGGIACSGSGMTSGSARFLSFAQERSSTRRRGGLRQPQRLVTALLRLQLDPAGRALSIELRVRLQARCLLDESRHQMWLA
jgi:hypothetical protein